MRFVWRKRRDVLHTVRDVSDFGVCPLFFLKNRITRKRSDAMKRGALLHRLVFDSHKKGAREISLEKAYRMSFTERIVGREVWIDNGVIGGYADIVMMEEGRIRVVELKSTDRSAAWAGSKLQALVYGVLFRKISKDVYVEVRNFGGKLFWWKEVDSNDEKLVEKLVREMEYHILTGFFPPRVGNHCNSCPFRNTCPVFKDAEEMLLGVIGVKGDERVHL